MENEEIEFKENEDEEIEKLENEFKANEDEIVKFKKDLERINKKIAVRRNNQELIKGKIAILKLKKINKKLEENNIKLEELGNNNQ